MTRDQRLRFGSDAGVVVKFNLAPAKATYDTPAMSRGELSQFVLRHRAQNSELRGMGDEDFRLDRKHGGDFHSESSQMFAHFQLMFTLATGPRWRFLQPFSGKSGGGLSFRFNLERNARSALRCGDGPRAVGFSMRMTKS